MRSSVVRPVGRRTATWLLSFSIVVTAVGLVAMPAGAKSGTPRAPDGYDVVRMKAAGLSMAVPDDWLALDPSSSTFQSVIEQATASNPKLAPLIEQFQSVAGDSYMAVDQSAASSFVSNVIVGPTGLSKAALSRPDLVESALQPQLSATNATDLEVVKTKVAGRRSLRSTATLMLTTPDGSPITAYSTSYYVPTKQGVVQLTFSTGSDGTQDETVQTMVDSVTIP